jgi:hypothetical protein
MMHIPGGVDAECAGVATEQLDSAMGAVRVRSIAQAERATIESEHVG